MLFDHKTGALLQLNFHNEESEIFEGAAQGPSMM
jgi:hypothetical protein